MECIVGYKANADLSERIQRAAQSGLSGIAGKNQVKFASATSKNGVDGLLENDRNSQRIVLRELTGTNSMERTFEKDLGLIDPDSGRKTALIYLNRDGGATLDSENEHGKVRDAKFIDPQELSDVVVLDPNEESFDEDLEALFARIDSFITNSARGRYFAAADRRSFADLDEEQLNLIPADSDGREASDPVVRVL